MAVDVILYEWDLNFVDGDFELSESQIQEAKLVIYANKGDWRQSPLSGAGFRDSRHAPVTDLMQREVKIQLQKLGLNSLKLKIENT